MTIARGEVTPAGLVVRAAEGGVLEILLHRPEVRNAISTPLLRELVSVLEEAESDADVRAVVITGGEAVFAAGADLSEMAGKDIQGILLEERPRLYQALARFPKPLLAAVSGYALGAGCELAMHADVVVAGHSAQFGQPEIRLGIMPGAGGTQRLTRSVGKSLAMKMVLTGESIGAEEARRNFTILAGTDDRNEGVRAFREKRKPTWTGR